MIEIIMERRDLIWQEGFLDLSSTICSESFWKTLKTIFKDKLTEEQQRVYSILVKLLKEKQ